LFGLLLGQISTLIAVALHKPLQGFSSVLPGWELVAYNSLGILSCLGILLGMFGQRRNVPVGRYVTSLLIEQYSTASLFLVMVVYSVQQAAKPGFSIPFILIFLSLGLLGKWFELRRDLKEMREDLAWAAQLTESRSEAETWVP
jgi:hypothetical protein